MVQFQPGEDLGAEPRSALILYEAGTFRRAVADEKDHLFARGLAFSPNGEACSRSPVRRPVVVPTFDATEFGIDPALRRRKRGGGATDRGRGVRRRVGGVLSRRQDVAVGVGDRTVRLFDLATGQERSARLGASAVSSPKKGEGAAEGFEESKARESCCLAFSPDRPLLASGPADLGHYGGLVNVPPITLWDVASAGDPSVRRSSRGYPLAGVLADGKTLASTGGEPAARIWDVATGREVEHRAGHPKGILALAVSPADGTVFTAGGDDGLVLHWDPADGRLLEAARRETELHQHPGRLPGWPVPLRPRPRGRAAALGRGRAEGTASARP